MQTKQVAWSLVDKPTVLLLPALSSISTRYEMRPLQERLSENFQIVAADWPGFGGQPRPPQCQRGDFRHTRLWTTVDLATYLEATGNIRP
jgi:pimeloyl-ACP methyl ester carboxylesterase